MNDQVIDFLEDIAHNNGQHEVHSFMDSKIINCPECRNIAIRATQLLEDLENEK